MTKYDAMRERLCLRLMNLIDLFGISFCSNCCCKTNISQNVTSSVARVAVVDVSARSNAPRALRTPEDCTDVEHH